MKKILSLLMFPVLCCGQYTSIPDQNFEQALIDFGYDDVIDGVVLTANINSVDSLNLGYKNISDLTGIEDFTALTNLMCYGNQLTSLDVSQNIGLTFLLCSWNQLTSLDVSQNTALTYLQCGANQLTSLDVSNNTALTQLICEGNQLTSLDVSNNTALTYLSCRLTQITSFDVSQNTALTNLECDGTPLTSLDVSNNTALTYLQCGWNQLTSLDVSNNTALTYLDCSHSQLNCLNLNNGNNLSLVTLWIYPNPNLNCIQVDDSVYSNANWINNNITFSLDSTQYFSVNCNYSLGCFNINPNSVQEIPHSISIYPNPTNENINISIDNFSANIETEVYDLIGNKLQTTNETTINLRDYSKGIYILKVAYGDRVEEVKVIKD